MKHPIAQCPWSMWQNGSRRCALETGHKGDHVYEAPLSSKTNSFDADLARLTEIRHLNDVRGTQRTDDVPFLVNFIDKLWAEYCRTLAEADKECRNEWCPMCHSDTEVRVQACRPEDRAMLQTEAGQELLKAAIADMRTVETSEQLCEAEAIGETHDLRPGVVCLACWNRLMERVLRAEKTSGGQHGGA